MDVSPLCVVLTIQKLICVVITIELSNFYSIIILNFLISVFF